jgi:NADPH:quinone reductase
MRSVIYTQTGDPEVLTLAERPVPAVGPGDVLVRLHVAGVNPTDWKFRRGTGPGQPPPFPQVSPGQDGAGVVEAIGADITSVSIGDRVWVWLAGVDEGGGTAQEYVALDAAKVVPLPAGASFDLGASLGVPAITAHRCLTVVDDGPRVLSPGSLAGKNVLVAGGAGAVGNAAIQLARWAGATVITTVSGDEKGALAQAAGAQHIINYRTEDAAARIRAVAPDGVSIVVEVAPTTNAPLNQAVLAESATVAVYANEAGPLVLEVRPHMIANTRYQFVMLYNIPLRAKLDAVTAVTAAVADGALRVGEDAGVPLHRYLLEQTAAAHTAVESNVVGKVLIDIA